MTSTDAAVPDPGTAAYWDHRYAAVGETGVSWFQPVPEISLELIGLVADHGAGIVDVGGGASTLVDHLLERGFHDVTVVDLSQQALGAARDRIGDSPVHWVVSDVREWQPSRTFDVWHDRAAYHFLTDPDDQRAYWDLVRDAVPHGGHVIVGTFAEDGPEMCSGLPVVRASADETADRMGDGFDVVATRAEVHVTPAGGTQSFVWTLARRT